MLLSTEPLSKTQPVARLLPTLPSRPALLTLQGPALQVFCGGGAGKPSQRRVPATPMEAVRVWGETQEAFPSGVPL